MGGLIQQAESITSASHFHLPSPLPFPSQEVAVKDVMAKMFKDQKQEEQMKRSNTLPIILIRQLTLQLYQITQDCYNCLLIITGDSLP